MPYSTVYKVFRSVALDSSNFEAQRSKQLSFPIRGAALCLPIVDRRKIVLVQRVLPPNVGWSLPGGRVGMDEDFEDAALRELEEETGITATEIDHQLIDEHTHFHSSKGGEISIDVKTYVVHLPKGTEPRQTEDDLPAQLFDLEILPDGLLNLDRAKIESFLERMVDFKALRSCL